MKPTKAQLNLIRQKLTIMDTVDEELLAGIKVKEKELYDRVIKVLQRLSTKGGKIDKSDLTNAKILQQLNGSLIKIINGSTFQSVTGRYLKNFDDVERVTKKILELENKINLKDYNLNTEKKLAIDDIARGLLNEEMLKSNIINPIKKIMYRHVTTGIDFKTAREELDQFINRDKKRGFLERYVSTLTQEALSRYDGLVNQKIATDFGLDGFSIVGSLIKTSAQVCIHMVNETGPFEDLVVNGKYAMQDLPKIIAIISKEPGFVQGTNESNYFINRNHWGCRHTFIPTRLLARDKEEIARRNGEVVPKAADIPAPAVRIAKTMNDVRAIAKSIVEENLNLTVEKVRLSSKLSVGEYNKRIEKLNSLVSEYDINSAAKDSKITLSFSTTKRYKGYVKYFTSGRIAELNLGSSTSPHRASADIKYPFNSKVDKENVNYSTIFHEFAHLISVGKNKTEEEKEFWSELIKIKSDYDNKLINIEDEDQESLSKWFLGKYASHHITEFMAEGFTEYKLHSKPTIYAKKVGKLVDKYFKK